MTRSSRARVPPSGERHVHRNHHRSKRPLPVRQQRERTPYTRKRLLILLAMVTVFRWLISWLWPMTERYVGYLWGQPLFLSVHVPGTVTFVPILALVFLFGRRVICGFNCPCVGIRETVGFASRGRTVRSKWIGKGRHVK